jgi:homoserine dehydrogenase
MDVTSLAIPLTGLLAALAFRRTLRKDEVQRAGLEALTPQEVQAARAQGSPYQLVASLEERGWGHLAARVGLERLDRRDPLAHVQGVTNALTIETDALTLTISGPGAGKEATAQGLLSDLIAVGKGVPSHTKEARYVG